MITFKSHLNVLLATILLFVPGFVAASSQGEKDPVKKETSVKKKDVKTWRWEEMFPSDMREALEEMPVAWVLFSPLEWHGEAMSFGTDPVIGQHVLDKVWKRVGGVRIPTVYIGSETEFKYLDKGVKSHWGLEVVTKELNHGSIYTRTLTLQLALEDYLYFLKREGFKLAIVNSGHGGTEHVQMMREVCERFSDDNFKAVFDLYGMATRLPIPEEYEFKGNSGHAGIREFSFLGAVDPDMVDIEKFGVSEQDRKTGLKQEDRDKIDFKKAEKAIEYLVEGSVEKIQSMVDEMMENE